MDVTIAVCTFGDVQWQRRALTVAYPSAVEQAHTILVHGESLHVARNTAAQLADSEWLIYLDADDRLAPGYVNAMGRATGDLRAPALFEDRDGTFTAVDLTGRTIENLNPCAIGTAIRRETVLAIGWQPWEAWEDWALFLTAYRRGAVIEHVPDAHYLATVRDGSRNRTVTDPAGLHAQILEASQ